MCIVYDVFVRVYLLVLFLNDCFNVGFLLQNKFWDVFVCQCCYFVVVIGDLKKVFLQVWIRELDRDVFRFYWKKNEYFFFEILRFIRVLFGLMCLLFLLGGVLECYLEVWELKMLELVVEFCKNFYVDDLLLGGVIVNQVQYCKEQVIEIFDDVGFILYKWYFNVLMLEGEIESKDIDLLFVKQQFQQLGEVKISLLGFGWDKGKDEVKVKFLIEEV